MKFLNSLTLLVSSVASAVAMSGSGRMTYYGNASDCPSDMALPACGYVDFDTQYYVAMNYVQYDKTLTNWANPNSASICNTCIKITYGNKSIIGKVIDKCPGCPEGGIDVSLPLFEKLADSRLGVVNVSWETSSCDGLIHTSGDSCKLKAEDNTPAKVSNASVKKTTTTSKKASIVYITKSKKPSQTAAIRVASTTTVQYRKPTTTTEAPKPKTTEAPKPTTTEAPKPTTTEAPKPEVTETVESTPSVEDENEEELAPAPEQTTIEIPAEVPTDIASDAYFTYLQYELQVARADIEEARREKEAARQEAEEAEKEKQAAIEDIKTINEEKLAFAEEARKSGHKEEAERYEKEAKELEKEALKRQAEAVKREQQALAREVVAKAKESAALAREADILLKQKEALEAQQKKVEEAVKNAEKSPVVGAIGSALGVAAILGVGGFTLKKYSPNSYESIKRNLSVKKLPGSYQSLKRSLSMKKNHTSAEETFDAPSMPQKTYVKEISIDMDETEGKSESK